MICPPQTPFRSYNASEEVLLLDGTYYTNARQLLALLDMVELIHVGILSTFRLPPC